MFEQGASDLHISTGEKPMIRVDGDLRRLDHAAVSKEDAQAILEAVLPQKNQKELNTVLNTDFSFELEGQARFRVNAFMQKNGLSFVFRAIPFEIPNFADLGLPEKFKELCHLENGLVLVTGPTGSGKSTSLASMIDYINRESDAKKHILTIEDPIEFVHDNHNCLINQREVGQHASSFSNALRAALREDPDIILVGELRDLETIQLALTAAETGHLIFSTLHTNSASKSINRIIDVFAESQAEMMRTILSESLQAVISQRLLRKPSGGRIGAFEILIATPAVRNLIREQKVSQILSAMQTGRQDGMITMDQSLEELKRQGLI